MPTSNSRRNSSRQLSSAQQPSRTSTRATRATSQATTDGGYHSSHSSGAAATTARATRSRPLGSVEHTHHLHHSEHDMHHGTYGTVDPQDLMGAPPAHNGDEGGAAGAYPDKYAATTGRPSRRAAAAASSGRRGVIADSEDDYAEEEEDEDAEGEAEHDARGDEYLGEEGVAGGEPDQDDAPPLPASGRGGRRGKAVAIAPASDEEDEEFVVHPPKKVVTTTASGRQTTRPAYYDDETDEDEKPTRGALRRGRSYNNKGDEDGFVEQDDEYDEEDGGYGRGGASKRRDSRRSSRRNGGGGGGGARSTRNNSKADRSYEGDDHSEETDDDDAEMLDLEDDEDDIVKTQPKRNLRQKTKIDYYQVPPLEALKDKSNHKGKGRFNGDDPFAGLPQNMTGAQWAALYPEKGGQPDSDSDDDIPNLSSPRKNTLFSSNAAAAAAGFGGPGAGGMFAGGAGMDSSGGPGNLGKVGGAALADTDPLGVSSTVSFDSVGGLGSHIQQLKEMVSLPLLYPEVFERFNITPPRGVLFHGPPGTGKTLLARALAASCSTEGRKISFFMRKGADCLSKWVGEAERQLRLLFEEAKNCQPSIIFFDEIDGLAPVRSSKQEQIHASIVSTLLALMDGMDGRGQVIVIGATNRPDAIDPALRRPGRFDREFYFPLPNLEGRRKILDIHTNGWNPPIEESFKDELAMLTKGYGGADLRALCTEAALNAVQRTYPQIYKTNDRLVIMPQKIDVTARDFVISQKNLIPSSARATSSSAAPLPPQLVPLLEDGLEVAKAALKKVLPEVRKANVLEEAEWEDDGGGFEKEKMLQAYETLRVFRPRLLVCGEPGMGQSYIGAAVLHHLEGFHVQTLDLATLVSDSGRTMEAACVQLFVEAKRHKPSILFIPSLLTWCASVNDTVKSTIKGLLETLDPSDPILLLAVVDGEVRDLPADVRSWFGFVKGNRVVLGKPNADQRRAFFADVLDGIQRPPNAFPDAMPRRKRVLEILAIAPPPPPRAPTAAELALQEQNDQRLLEYLKWKLGPILNELKKRYKRFTRSLFDDWRSDDLAWRVEQQKQGKDIVGLGTQPYHNVDLDSMHIDLYKGYYYHPDDFLDDILRIQANAEVNAILENDAEAPVKGGQLVNHTKVMIDQTFDQAFRNECAKMSERKKEQEKNAPPGTKVKGRKGKGKDLPEDGGIVAAAQAAAAAGGAGMTSRRRSFMRPGGLDGEGGTDGTATPVQGGPAETIVIDDGEEDVDPERSALKRSRDGEAMLAGDGDDAPGPSKRAKSVNGVNGLEGYAVASTSEDQQTVNGHGAGPSSLNNLLNGAGSSSSAVASSSTGSRFANADLFAPSTSTALPASAISPTNLNAGLLVPPPTGSLVPMQVGAAPTLSSSDLGGVVLPPTRPAATGAGFSVTSSVSPAPPAGIFASDGPPRQASPPSGDQRMGSPTPPPPTPPRDEPLPDFSLSPASLVAMGDLLSNGTDDLSVDQLEQLRAACYDVVWRGRSAWDRASMVDELRELVEEFVSEVRAMNAELGLEEE